jgi:hypothetical protein
MKKFLVFLLILIILGGAGFFLGWAQLGVPHGAVGVMRSKTHGVDPVPVAEGQIRWVWYKLIPGNVKIISFKPKPVSRSFRLEGILPQAGIYRRFAGRDARFSWALSISYAFSFKESAFPKLVAEHALFDQDDLDVFTEQSAHSIEEFLKSQLEFPGSDSEIAEEKRLKAIYENGTSPAITELITRTYPFIENPLIRFDAVQAPDFALYESAASLYADYLEAQEATLRPVSSDEASRRISNQFRLDELERYGELFSKYPMLLDYLKFENEAPAAR